jgi:signal transduction histidine kinase
VSVHVGLLAWALAASALHLRGRRRLVLAARAGHEVRGPLCVARLALDGLERSARVEAIELELRRAALALDDLSGAGRGRRASECLEPIDVGRLLTDAADAWLALARAHGSSLSIEPAVARVLGDRLRLAQACANLVSNAIEHGGGTVRVRSSAGAGRVRVEVADTGPGLPAPVPTLVGAARGRRSRRGHGLAIAAAIAERHGGRLTSVPVARGAHLVLELPEAPRQWPLWHPASPRADAAPLRTVSRGAVSPRPTGARAATAVSSEPSS